MQQLKILISGGGTGGHIFPALSIANAIKRRYPLAEILFVGAEDRMEMERVPAASYPIVGLPVAGFDRKNLLKNVNVLIRLFKSMRLAKKIVKDFQPHIVIGVGGYASGPTLQAANSLKIPTLLQEQNSYAGITNKLLAKKAAKICVAYEGMEKFFPKDKIVLTGNPVRQDLECSEAKRKEAYEFFRFNPDKKTVLVLGGSLGASSINISIMSALQAIEESDVQLIWQSGNYYYSVSKEKLRYFPKAHVYLASFISRMDLAYSIADLIVSRAGAGSISEFCLLGKPVILVPSPNVAEDHQTKNAEALLKKNAAILIPDDEIMQNLIPKAMEIIHNENKLKRLSENIVKLALPNAANKIIDEIDNILDKTVPEANFLKSIDYYTNIYFIGAGGIGMSALIRYFLFHGKNVAGYDRVESELTKRLNVEGAQIHYEDKVNLIPNIYKSKKNTLIVFTPAVPEEHSELKYFRQNNFNIFKRAQVLGEITRKARGLCVAGTHGKTTTSSMIAHLLKQSAIDCNAFLGGILKNYDSNLMVSAKSDLTVIEADEYDRSFHWLTPYMAVITSVAPDHLDIYKTKEAYKEAFKHFASLIRENGVLLMETGVDIEPKLKTGVRLYRYGIASGDFHAENINIGDGKISFDLVTPERIISDIQLGVPVKINILNGIAALAIAFLNGVSDDELREGMASFMGAKRRFDFHIKRDDCILIDDYAHHPEELDASITSVRELYPDKKLTVIFQPHLYSRTNDFYREFAQALSKADEVILIPIYPAREEPIPGVSSQMILDLVTSPEKNLYSKEELLEAMRGEKRELVLVAGAGDIELLVEPLKEILDA
jgi:UDP-N-acetylmuramate--alanine ligase